MEATATDLVISAAGLAKTYYVGFFRRKAEALRGLDLAVRKNEIMGFLGPNGAGKTTTIKVLLGIIRPSGGTASILGRPIGDIEAKNKIGFLPEQPYFYEYLTGREFLDFYSRFHGLRGRIKRERIVELLKLVGVDHAADTPLRKYSKGMLQRVGMAQALLGDPELVILDEPMSGLDPIGRRDIREIILSLKERGKTVFFSSHILPDVEQICDRVCIVHQGRVRAVGRLSEILNPEVTTVDLQFEGLPQEAAAAFAELGQSRPGLRVMYKGGLTLITAPGWEAAREAEDKGRALGGRLVYLLPHRETLENYFFRGIGQEGGAK